MLSLQKHKKHMQTLDADANNELLRLAEEFPEDTDVLVLS